MARRGRRGPTATRWTSPAAPRCGPACRSTATRPGIPLPPPAHFCCFDPCPCWTQFSDIFKKYFESKGGGETFSWSIPGFFSKKTACCCCTNRIHLFTVEFGWSCVSYFSPHSVGFGRISESLFSHVSSGPVPPVSQVSPLRVLGNPLDTPQSRHLHVAVVHAPPTAWSQCFHVSGCWIAAVENRCALRVHVNSLCLCMLLFGLVGPNADGRLVVPCHDGGDVPLRRLPPPPGQAASQPQQAGARLGGRRAHPGLLPTGKQEKFFFTSGAMTLATSPLAPTGVPGFSAV